MFSVCFYSVVGFYFHHIFGIKSDKIEASAMIACMGGNCQSRTRCAHYYAQSNSEPCERLCGKLEAPEQITSPMQFVENALLGPINLLKAI